MEIFDTKKLLEMSGLFWQYPVKTEEEFYNQNKDNPNFCGIPWATIIDKNIDTNSLLKFLLQFMKHKYYYTCCQHIHFRKILPLMKILGIRTVYTPHKMKNENELYGINLIPCPLYAVNFEDNKRNKIFIDQSLNFLNNERDFLYSFMGGYQNNYLTDVRKNIFTMKHPENTYIENTGSWHFNNVVYSAKQNKNTELNIDKTHINKTEKYNKLLLNSRFSLCPSGSGPNSIRFWESLACGSIPILLADTLELPYNVNWDDAIICLEEKNVSDLESILSNISLEREKQMRLNCISIYNKLKNNYSNYLLNKRDDNKITLFTSYSCDISDNIVQTILTKWKILNPEHNILYFSDSDINDFFKETNYYDLYKKMKNGVAIADFFRINYINKYGGYWFDIDIEPFKFIPPHIGNVHLFDCGFGNISYMFIGGKPNQKLFYDTIKQVVKNINNNIVMKTQHIIEITGPRNIQNIICNALHIENKDGNIKSDKANIIILKGTEYEFIYNRIKLKTTKTNDYSILQKKYSKKQYYNYNYI
jgi:mannosyltransferase OCH1-like enzyme